MIPRRNAAIALVAGLALSACGASEQEQFAESADAICERVNREYTKVAEETGSITALYPAVRRAHAELTALDAPETSRAQFARYLAVNRQRVDLMGRAITDPAPDPSSDPLMKRAEALQAQSGDLAGDLGFEQCS
ncbi:MAG: hypothetical protein JHC95_22705 [Solirubrobacteraceae bacterium]|nr:hypothetical protein [Solirubrobacteraceae bacterium]